MAACVYAAVYDDGGLRPEGSAPAADGGGADPAGDPRTNAGDRAFAGPGGAGSGSLGPRLCRLHPWPDAGGIHFCRRCRYPLGRDNGRCRYRPDARAPPHRHGMADGCRKTIRRHGRIFTIGRRTPICGTAPNSPRRWCVQTAPCTMCRPVIFRRTSPPRS